MTASQTQQLSKTLSLMNQSIGGKNYKYFCNCKVCLPPVSGTVLLENGLGLVGDVWCTLSLGQPLKEGFFKKYNHKGKKTENI